MSGYISAGLDYGTLQMIKDLETLGGGDDAIMEHPELQVIIDDGVETNSRVIHVLGTTVGLQDMEQTDRGLPIAECMKYYNVTSSAFFNEAVLSPQYFPSVE